MLLKNLIAKGTPSNENPAPERRSGIVRRAPSVNEPGYHDLPVGLFTKALDTVEQRPEESRLGTPPPFHASSMLDVCERAYALAHRHGPIVTVPDRGMRIVWAIGRAVEQHARSLLVEGIGRHAFYGIWSCGCGHSKIAGFYRPDHRCEVCGQPASSYGEAVIEDRDLRIKGSPDLLYFRNGKFIVVEFKSMSKTRFEALKDPLPFHVAQAGFYRRAMLRNGMKVSDKVVIFVVNKDFSMGAKGGQHPTYKEFHVAPEDHPTAKRVMDRMEESARTIAAYFEDGTVPERTVCQSPSCDAARSCPVVGFCFQA